MSNNNEEYKTGAEGIALLEKTKWGKEKKPKKPRRIVLAKRRIIGTGRYLYHRWRAERKEKKEIYREAYKRAEKAAIITKARREARARYAPRPRGRGRGVGLFDLPKGFAMPTVMGEAPRKAPRRKRRKKRRKARRPKRRRRYYY